MAHSLEIAVVGVAGCYAGAANAQRYWQNILDKVDAITVADDDWTSCWLDKDNWAQRNDRIYTNRGGFLRDLAVIDPAEYGVMPSQADGGDPDHMLALKFAGDALADAGYRKRDFDRSRAGVILGRGTYANRGQANVLFHGMFVDELMRIVGGVRPDLNEAELAELRGRFKKQLPQYNGEVVSQITPNVITGLICNRLDLMGPNYIVDAACASTLMALDQAIQELTSGRCDLMITGGTQAHTPPQLYVQFSQIRALAEGQLRPFQKGHSGTLLGEGLGMLVLKRRADAERDGDRIYALIQGIGTSSDGRAKGLLTPRPEGQVLAVRRAYESSGVDPDTVDLIEAHGTGTDVGDRTEIQTLQAIFGGRGAGPQIAVGTVKSMIGHCLPASGSASLIKTALALHHKVLPPTLCDEPDPELHLEQTPLYINTEARPWIHGKPHARRAGVNAFGFGGINSHVIMEEYRGPAKVQVQVLHRPSPSELITLAADSREELVALARRLLERASSKPAVDLAQLALASSAHARGSCRLAFAVQNIGDLVKKLEQALDKLGQESAASFKTRSGVYYGEGEKAGKVCFLYPGEGAQYPGMLSDLCLHFPQVRDWFDFIETTALRNGTSPRAPIVFPAPTGYDAGQRKQLEDQLYEMDVAAETVFAGSLAIQALLDDLGFEADAMLGHSTGENTAITACHVRRFKSRDEIAESVRDLNRIFRDLESQGRIAEGSLLTVGALSESLRAEVLAHPQLQVAMDNCPNQLVLFGPPEATQALSRRLSEEGAICQELPFGRAYHTPLFKPIADAYRDYFRSADFGAGRTALYSARSVGPFPDEPDAIRELAAQQWENPVRFTETVRRLYEDGYRIFVEVGPSGNLTSFVGDTLRDQDDVIAVSTNSRRRADVAQLHSTFAQLFAAGVAFEPSVLYTDRRIEPIDLFAAPAAQTRRQITLTLRMPTLRLPEDWSAQHPLPVASQPVAIEPPAASEQRFEITAAPIPGVAAAMANDTANVPAGVAADDPRMAALKSHFSLMQSFLDSQARVLGIGMGTPSATIPEPAVASTPAVAAFDAEFPLLGAMIELDSEHLVCERTYSPEVDLVLLDHSIGQPPSMRQTALRPLIVVPFTFSMEIAAEAACRLAGGNLKVTAIENCRGHRWLGLDDDNRLDIRIMAERMRSPAEAPRINVKLLRLDRERGASPTLVFEAHVLLAQSYPAAPAPRHLASPQLRPPRHNVAGKLYQHRMFHGPRLQGVKTLHGWNESGIEADLETIATHDYFSFTQTPRFRLDPALLDATGQLAGYWLADSVSWEHNCFPYGLGHYTQYADPLPARSRLHCRGQMKLGEHKLECHFDLIDAQGRVVARAANWDDVRCRAPENLADFRMAPTERYLTSAYLPAPMRQAGMIARRIPAFEPGCLDQAGGLWKRMLAGLILDREERRFLTEQLPETGQRREEWLVGRVCAKEAVREWAAEHLRLHLACADIHIGTSENGAPFVAHIVGWPAEASLPDISISHSRRSALAVCAPPGSAPGIDLQYLDRVDEEDMLSAAFSPEESARFLRVLPQHLLKAATVALWCAKEAAAKSAGTGLEGRPLEWVIVGADLQSPNARWAQVRHGARLYAVELHDEGAAVVAICRGSLPQAARSVARQ
jgi:acyl transferase domain-containing protein/phosphopantetheinyl transferase